MMVALQEVKKMTAKQYSNLDVWEMGAENTANLLNELHEENKNLKDFTLHNYSETNKIINNLQKENEQLKQRIKVLENTIDGLTGTIAHFDLDEVI